MMNIDATMNGAIETYANAAASKLKSNLNSISNLNKGANISNLNGSNLNSHPNLSSARIALAGADNSNLSDAQKAALKEQTDAFEAFMLKEVLDLALGEDDKNSLFPKDAGDKIYKSMYNEAMSENLAGNFGFSEILYNFLLERAK